MKKIMILTGLVLFALNGLFALELKTGDSTAYFPIGAPKVGNKNGSESSCFVTKISKAQGYSDGTYEIQFTSCDWVGASVFPVTFNYLVKKGTQIELAYTRSLYLGKENRKFTVTEVSENRIFLEEIKPNVKDIEPSENSL